jgi:hypothetical protein
MLLRSESYRTENPVLIAPVEASPKAYHDVFERVLNVVERHFNIDYANRYDGQIICAPKIAPGIEQPWRSGSPDPRERLLATIQTMRFRCIINMRPAEEKGYFVQVTIYRELEDLARPIVAPNASVFRDTASVDRSLLVIDPTIPSESNWIPKGRDTAFENELLQQIRKCQYDSP